MTNLSNEARKRWREQAEAADPADTGTDMAPVTSAQHPYDHEVEAMTDLLMELRAKYQGKQGVDLDAMRREIIERYAGLGFRVTVDVYEDMGERGTFDFEVTVQERTEGILWDPDRQVHEVTNDILGLGDEGIIKS